MPHNLLEKDLAKGGNGGRRPPHRNDKIYQERRKRKYECVCGGKFTYSHKARHYHSKKHLDYIKKLYSTNI